MMLSGYAGSPLTPSLDRRSGIRVTASDHGGSRGKRRLAVIRYFGVCFLLLLTHIRRHLIGEGCGAAMRSLDLPRR
jgi:hypothetical protein